MHLEMLGEREEVKPMPQVRKMGMSRERNSKGLPAENTAGSSGGSNSSPGRGEACSHAHVQEDTHVCTPSQGPVLTREGGFFPRQGEEEEGDAISGSLPAPPATGTTPHTSTEPPTPRLGKHPLRNSQHTPAEEGENHEKTSHQKTPPQTP